VPFGLGAKRGKTKKSLGRVHLPKELADDLALEQECPDSSAEAFIFPGAKGGFVVSWTPAIAAGACCTSWRKTWNCRNRPFQVIRRTVATLAQKKGTAMDIQGLLRHSRAATTTDVYVQENPESVQVPVHAINAEPRVKPEESHAD
jgi:integrase